MYSNGFRTWEDVAKSSVADLVEKIEHLDYRVARQLISAAKVSIVFVRRRYELILRRWFFYKRNVLLSVQSTVLTIHTYDYDESRFV